VLGLLTPLLALLLVFAAGYAYVVAPGPRRPATLVLAHSHLVGAAALGLGFTVGLVVTNGPSLVWCALGLSVPVVLGLWRRRTNPPRAIPETEETAGSAPLTRWEWGLVLLLGVGIATAAARLVLLPLDWDGWAIWQFKAKALVDGSLRHFLTSPDFSFAHPDYPLLMPSLTWWLSPFTYSSKVGQLSGFLFFLDVLAIFYAAARSRMSRPLALTGLVVLVSWPLVMKHSVSGFSDLALAAFVLATAALLTDDDLWLAVPLFIGAVLTKNEGLFTLVGVVAATVLVAVLPRARATANGASARPRWLAPTLMAAAGLTAVLAWSAMKQRWGLAADLLDARQWPADLPSTVLQRVPTIAAGFLREVLSVGPRYPGWGLFWPVALLGFGLALRNRRRDTLVMWIIIGAHLAGTVAAYALTPLDPALHLSRSLDRLLLQIAPTVLLAALTAVALRPVVYPVRDQS